MPEPAEMAVPWLAISILLPLLGAITVSLRSQRERIWLHSLVFSGFTFIAALGALANFLWLGAFAACDRRGFWSLALDEDLFLIDGLSAPLIPLVALLHFVTLLATSRTKSRRFSFPLTLLSEAILLAMLSARAEGLMIALLIAGTLPVYWELKQQNKPTRLFVLHMLLFALLLTAGQILASLTPVPSDVAILLLLLGVLVRNGVVPVHTWLTDLFEQASFGTALLFVTPLAGAYAALRLVLPMAPDWILQTLSVLALGTALYASGMALVQQEARRFFAYLFLSHSSLVLMGLGIATPIGLTAALCLWLSVGLSLAGFGLTLRCVEARTGRLSLTEYHGLYEKTPLLAGFFLLTGMASIGFPGTIGFIGTELLVESASRISPWMETLIVVTTVINSIAVLHAYFRVFTGKPHAATIDLRCRPRERIAVLVLTLLIIGGGLYPQPGLTSRYHAAIELLKRRTETLPDIPDAPHL